MTIAFIPGDVNRDSCVLQGAWKNHNIVVYGSGNNLIITSVTHANSKGDAKHLQTVYLELDPLCVDIHENGWIAVGLKSKKLKVYKPVNEYMSKPQWEETVEVPLNQVPRCLQWAPLEDELVMGGKDSIELYHVFHDEEYNDYKAIRRWNCPQAVPTSMVKITKTANKIVSMGKLDRLVKVWSRINYGDDNTLFEMSYLNHDKGTFVTDIHVRSTNGGLQVRNVESALSRRGFTVDDNESSDIIYTFTNTMKLRIWASFEFNGHSHIRCWGLLDLKKRLEIPPIDTNFSEGGDIEKCSETADIEKRSKTADIKKTSNISSITIVESYLLDDAENTYSYDILLILLHDSTYILFKIENITSTPPNNIKFIQSPTTKLAPRHSFPSHLPEKCDSNASCDFDFVQSDDFAYSVKPIDIPQIVPFQSNLSLLIHDRTKNTIRCLLLNKSALIKSDLHIKLLSKYQGHTKSIRKLIKSSSGEFLLSTSNFALSNYLWKPFYINERDILLNKVCIVDLQDLGTILSALVINRRLCVTLTSEGFISVLDMDTYNATILDKMKVANIEEARSFHYTQQEDNYILFAVFSNEVATWKLSKDRLSPLPSNLTLEASSINSFEGLIAYIDKDGLLTVSSVDLESMTWTPTNQVFTYVQNSLRVQFTNHKVAVLDSTGKKMTVWNIKSGALEYEEEFESLVTDLAWTFLEDENCLLSVAFDRFIVLYVQLRYDYTNDIPNFARIKKLDLSQYTSHEIGDAEWLGQFLIVGCGNQFFIDDKWVQLGTQSDNFVDSTIRQLMIGYTNDNTEEKDDTGYRELQEDLVFDINYLARVLNGPLPVYHPQFLIQCLFMYQMELVQDILCELFNCIRDGRRIVWDLHMDIPMRLHKSNKRKAKRSDRYTIEIFDHFNQDLSGLLIDKLTRVTLPLITRHQQSTLITIVNIVQYLIKYIPLVDENAIRFLIGVKLCQLSSKKLQQVTMRDVNWALHLENKEMLVGIIEETYGIHTLRWEHIKKLKMMYWVDTEKLTKLVERVNQNEYADTRNPAGIMSLLYILLHKKQILIELWKLSTEAEKDKIVKFLQNDFLEKRWKLAANKNAFVLLGKHRWVDAAYFFLLGGAIKDCCLVLCNKLGDRHLSVAVAKLYDQEYLPSLMDTHLIPRALELNDRWSTSWIFWQQEKKEKSVQALIKSPHQMFPEVSEPLEHSHKVVHFLKDDPLLIVLFQDLRNKKINYWRGATQIGQDEEFEFVVKVSEIYSRMGCDYLSVLLVRNWVFDGGKVAEAQVPVEAKRPQPQVAPPQAMFEEPDMSAFDFGF